MYSFRYTNSNPGIQIFYSSKATDDGLGSRPATGASRRSSRMEDGSRDGSRPTSTRSRDERVEKFTQKHAAGAIQRQWRQRKQRQQEDEVRQNYHYY